MIRRVVVVVAAALGFFLMPAPASSASLTWKQWDRAQVNALRAAHHLAPLRYQAAIQAGAQQWANRMAAAGHVRQNVNVGPCWSIPSATVFGDNVGLGPTVPSIEAGLERSPSHRANMLDRSFRFLGIGIARAGGWIYMDQVFCG